MRRSGDPPLSSYWTAGASSPALFPTASSLIEFTSGEYAVTFTLDLVVIGEASRQISVPERFETVVTGDLPPDAFEDVYEFTASEGAFVGVLVDTVSDEHRL